MIDFIETINLPLILSLLFLIVTFLQSGIDKIVDWKGNLEFITEHFKNSPLGKSVPLLLATILVMEVVAGVLMLGGVVQLFIDAEAFSVLSYLGLALSGLSLIFLLIGQRLAKDYAGAMTLAVYFGIVLLGFLFM